MAKSKQFDQDRCAKERPSIEQIAWAAGVYEGEGYVGINGPKYFYLSAAVTQKERWLCDRLKALFGGHIRSMKNNGRPHAIYRWSIGGPRARGFLYTVFAFLGPRRRSQVKAALLATS